MDTYDDKNKCKLCNEENELSEVYVEDGYIFECKTTCKKCENVDYWITGFYIREP